MINYQKYITLEVGKRSAQPCIRGLRITVYDVLNMLANDMTTAEIIDDFPELTSADIADILACLAYEPALTTKVFRLDRVNKARRAKSSCLIHSVVTDTSKIHCDYTKV